MNDTDDPGTKATILPLIYRGCENNSTCVLIIKVHDGIGGRIVIPRDFVLVCRRRKSDDGRLVVVGANGGSNCRITTLRRYEQRITGRRAILTVPGSKPRSSFSSVADTRTTVDVSSPSRSMMASKAVPPSRRVAGWKSVPDLSPWTSSSSATDANTAAYVSSLRLPMVLCATSPS